MRVEYIDLVKSGNILELQNNIRMFDIFDVMRMSLRGYDHLNQVKREAEEVLRLAVDSKHDNITLFLTKTAAKCGYFGYHTVSPELFKDLVLVANDAKDYILVLDLLRYKADYPNLLLSEIDSNNPIYNLCLSAATGNIDKLQLILSNNAQIINFTIEANLPTALIYAVLSGNVATVEKLLELGADVNAKDKWGKTALHYAAENGHLDIVAKLLEFGADVNAIDNSRKTAFDGGQNNNIKALLKATEALDKVNKADPSTKATMLTKNITSLEGILNRSPNDIKANIEKIASVLLSRVHYQLLSEHKAKHSSEHADEFAQLVNNNVSAIKDFLCKLKETYKNIFSNEGNQLDQALSEADNIESNVNNIIKGNNELLTIVKDKLYLDSGLVGLRGANKSFSETLDPEKQGITAVKASRDGEAEANQADQPLPYLNGLPLSLVYVFLSESNLSKAQKILEAKPEILVKAFKGAPLAIQEIVMKEITTELSLESKNYCPPSFKVKGLSKLKDEFINILNKEYMKEEQSCFDIFKNTDNADYFFSANETEAQQENQTELSGITTTDNN